MFRPHWVFPVQGCLCFPSLHCSGSRLLYMERALCSVEFQFSGPPQKCGFSCTCVLCLPRPERPRQPEAWAASPRVRRTFFLRGPSARRWSGLRKSLDRNWGPVCRVGGGGFSGPELAPFPSPLPPSSSGDGPALLWSFSVPLFCEPPAVCSSRLIFFALPQFIKAPSDCSQGLRAGPYPKQCRPLLSVSPPLAGGGCGSLEYFSAGSCF